MEVKWLSKKLGAEYPINDAFEVFSRPRLFYTLLEKLNGKPLPFKCCNDDDSFFKQLELTNACISFLADEFGVEVAQIDRAELMRQPALTPGLVWKLVLRFESRSSKFFKRATAKSAGTTTVDDENDDDVSDSCSSDGIPGTDLHSNGAAEMNAAHLRDEVTSVAAHSEGTGMIGNADHLGQEAILSAVPSAAALDVPREKNEEKVGLDFASGLALQNISAAALDVPNEKNDEKVGLDLASGLALQNISEEEDNDERDKLEIEACMNDKLLGETDENDLDLAKPIFARKRTAIRVYKLWDVLLYALTLAGIGLSAYGIFDFLNFQSELTQAVADFYATAPSSKTFALPPTSYPFWSAVIPGLVMPLPEFYYFTLASTPFPSVSTVQGLLISSFVFSCLGLLMNSVSITLGLVRLYNPQAWDWPKLRLSSKHEMSFSGVIELILFIVSLVLTIVLLVIAFGESAGINVLSEINVIPFLSSSQTQSTTTAGPTSTPFPTDARIAIAVGAGLGSALLLSFFVLLWTFFRYRRVLAARFLALPPDPCIDCSTFVQTKQVCGLCSRPCCCGKLYKLVSLGDSRTRRLCLDCRGRAAAIVGLCPLCKSPLSKLPCSLCSLPYCRTCHASSNGIKIKSKKKSNCLILNCNYFIQLALIQFVPARIGLGIVKVAPVVMLVRWAVAIAARDSFAQNAATGVVLPGCRLHREWNCRCCVAMRVQLITLHHGKR